MNRAHKKLVSGLLTGCLAAVALAACGSSDKAGDDDTASEAKPTAAAASGTICVPKKKVGYVDIYNSSPAGKSVSDMVESATSTLGWDFDLVDGQADFVKIAKAIQSYVDKKYDLILIASMDAPTIRESLEAAKAAGIPAMAVAAGGPESDLYAAQYTEDEYKLGVTAGEYVGAIPDAKIADLATTLNYSGVAREEGFVDGLENAGGNAEIVATQQIDASDPTGNATKAMTDIITAHPEVNTVWAVFDVFGTAAAAALRAKGASADIYSAYATPPNLELIGKGELKGVVDANLPLTGAVAVDQFLNYTVNDTPFDPDAIVAAGDLGYRMVTDATTAFDPAETIAPFVDRWTTEFPC